MHAGPEVIPFGVLTQPDAAGRRDVELITLTSSALGVSLLTRGATLWSVEAPDRTGHREPVALHLPTLDAIETLGDGVYLGATCGRVANRIAGASFPLDGRTVTVAANSGPHQLHGGPEGFDRRIWDVAEVTPGEDGGRVVLALTSPDGDQGFPGALEVTATYELHGHVLRIAFESVTDAPTVVNLANHAYWNLGGPGRWDVAGAVGDHELRLPAARTLPIDDETIPVGGLVPVAGTPLDLRQPTALADVLGRVPFGIDQSFEVPETDEVERAAFDGLEVAAELHHPASGRTLTVATDQAAVQVYTGNWLGPPFASQAAICLETQQWPDAPNRPDLGSVVLRPGEHHRSTTDLTFGTR